MTWVLILILGASSAGDRVVTLQQEFTSLENCEKARLVLIKANNYGSYTLARASGCFQK